MLTPQISEAARVWRRTRVTYVRCTTSGASCLTNLASSPVSVPRPMYTPYEQRQSEIPFASAEYLSFASRNSFLGVPAVTADEMGDGDVVILGAPFDWGTTFRPGARFGPRAIGNADYGAMDGYRPHLPTGLDPFEVLGVVDIGDVYVRPGDLDLSIERIADTVEHCRSCRQGPDDSWRRPHHHLARRPRRRPGPRLRRDGTDPLRCPRRHRLHPERLAFTVMGPRCGRLDRIGGGARSSLRPDRPPRLLAGARGHAMDEGAEDALLPDERNRRPRPQPMSSTRPSPTRSRAAPKGSSSRWTSTWSIPGWLRAPARRSREASTSRELLDTVRRPGKGPGGAGRGHRRGLTAIRRARRADRLPGQPGGARRSSTGWRRGRSAR